MYVRGTVRSFTTSTPANLIKQVGHVCATVHAGDETGVLAHSEKISVATGALAVSGDVRACAT
jgi:hypothetical protein